MTVNNVKVKAGEVIINNKPAEQAYSSNAEKNIYLEALKLTQNEDRFATFILTRGGGKVGQLEAIVHGMTRAVEKVDKEAYRSTLKKRGLFSRDSRTRQRRMVGTGGKARRAKQSPKR